MEFESAERKIPEKQDVHLEKPVDLPNAKLNPSRVSVAESPENLQQEIEEFEQDADRAMQEAVAQRIADSRALLENSPIPDTFSPKQREGLQAAKDKITERLSNLSVSEDSLNPDTIKEVERVGKRAQAWAKSMEKKSGVSTPQKQPASEPAETGKTERADVQSSEPSGGQAEATAHEVVGQVVEHTKTRRQAQQVSEALRQLGGLIHHLGGHRPDDMDESIPGARREFMRAADGRVSDLKQQLIDTGIFSETKSVTRSEDLAKTVEAIRANAMKLILETQRNVAGEDDFMDTQLDSFAGMLREQGISMDDHVAERASRAKEQASRAKLATNVRLAHEMFDVITDIANKLSLKQKNAINRKKIPLLEKFEQYDSTLAGMAQPDQSFVQDVQDDYTTLETLYHKVKLLNPIDRPEGARTRLPDLKIVTGNKIDHRPEDVGNRGNPTLSLNREPTFEIRGENLHGEGKRLLEKYTNAAAKTTLFENFGLLGRLPRKFYQWRAKVWGERADHELRMTNAIDKNAPHLLEQEFTGQFDNGRTVTVSGKNAGEVATFETVDAITDNSLDQPKIVKARNGMVAYGCDAGVGYKDGKTNEDRQVVNTKQNRFMSIDGMGGHAGGEIAAQIMAEEAQEGFRKGLSPEDIQRRAHERMYEALAALPAKDEFEQARNLDGGAAYISFEIKGRELQVAGAGDVGLMVVGRNGKIRFETIDDVNPDGTLNNVVQGRSPGKTRRYPSQPKYPWQLKPGDRIIAASDGLWKNISREKAAQLVHGRSIQDAISILSRTAKSRMKQGVGPDNINVLIYDYQPARGLRRIFQRQPNIKQAA